MSDNERLREVIAQIADLVNSLDGYEEERDEGEEEEWADESAAAQEPQGHCSPKVLPTRLLVKAAEVATRINPVNAPVFGPMAAIGADGPMEPMRIAVMTAKYWGPAPRKLTVSFMESTPANLRARIVSHLNAWATSGSVSFVETTGMGDVRISRGPGGYWSYLGTDIKLIPRNRPTMNLQGFTMSTPESEYRRVVRHEAGHTLGFPHEHMRAELVARIDKNKAYAYFRTTQGWDKATVDQQVLTPLSAASIFGTPVDQTSIMCYQLPGSITKDGRPIVGGLDINATDHAFNGLIYPRLFLDTKAVRDVKPKREKAQAPEMALAGAEDWDESEDPEIPELV